MEARRIDFSFDTRMLSKVLELYSNHGWLHKHFDGISQLISLCDEYNKADLILYILSTFSRISADELDEHLKNIARHIMDKWNLSSDDTCIVCKDIEGKTDSSAAIQQLIKTHFAETPNWSSNANFRSDIKKVVLDESIKNIVVVDDFSGTGTGLEKLANWAAGVASSRQNDLNMYAAFVCTMDQTLQRAYNPIIKEIFSAKNLKKSISDSDLPDVSSSLLMMQDIEKKFGLRNKSYSLGYGQSEAAIKIGSLNTANNVFPIFWDTNGAIKVMFPRLKK